MPSISEKRATFFKLHEAGCFVIPNPWDIGSAKYLQSLGFKALASTSSGLAWSQARADNNVPRELVLEHLAELVAATDVPINADFESGFATDVSMLTESVRAAVRTGIAGLSIEDSTGHEASPLMDFASACERMKAARRAIDLEGGDTLLVGRSEGFIVGRPDLEETIRRLQAYSQAGADCLYAPGLTTRDQIVAVVQAVTPKPVNLLVGTAFPMTVADIEQLGVRRISVGGALARSAWGGFMRAAMMIAEHGKFDELGQAASGKSLNALFEAS